MRDQQSKPLTFMKMVKEARSFSSLLAIPPLTVNYVEEEDFAVIQVFDGLLPRADWQELKRLVDRFYGGHSDEDIERIETEADEERRERAAATYHALQERKRAPKPGYVYLVRAGNGLYKIGYSKNVKSRLTNYRTNIPEGAELIHQIYVSDMMWAESFLHSKFNDKRRRGEWFELKEDDVTWVCALERLEP